MSGKHTPGPWKLSAMRTEEGFSSNCYKSVNGERWGQLANIVVRFKGNAKESPEGLANATLIAAAPDMLEALEEAYDLLADYVPSTPIREAKHASMVSKTAAAIAKAKGETS